MFVGKDKSGGILVDGCRNITLKLA